MKAIVLFLLFSSFIYDIISEFSPHTYQIGMAGMASAGKDTEGSQWFVMHGNYPHLNGRYSIFLRLSGVWM
jgi:cyclophilin family peptidyl-prolyl cis-trans isomerase